MKNFLYNFDNDEILYFISLIDADILELTDKLSSLEDLKDEFLTYLSENKED